MTLSSGSLFSGLTAYMGEEISDGWYDLKYGADTLEAHAACARFLVDVYLDLGCWPKSSHLIDVAEHLEAKAHYFF